MMKFAPRRWCLLLFVLAVAGLACGLGSKKDDLPQPPSGYIQPNEEASKRVQDNFNQSLQEASGSRQFRFRVTNEEITSIVAMALQKRADIPFSEPQIWFTAGKIHMTGKVEGVVPTPLPALIVAIPAVNSQGRLEVEISEARMGSLDFPEGVIENLTQTINETLADLQLNIEVTAIEVLEGEMLVAGKRINQ
ncbi:MAG: hypothetical protein ACE5G8_00430 [Anaerolineae bacterium]